jgi:hypothetical protein
LAFYVGSFISSFYSRCSSAYFIHTLTTMIKIQFNGVLVENF